MLVEPAEPVYQENCRLLLLWGLLSGGGKCALIQLVMMVTVALAAPLLCDHSHRIASGPALSAPSIAHSMGTDELGVDLWAQIAHGARISLLVGTATALIACISGAVVGIA